MTNKKNINDIYFGENAATRLARSLSAVSPIRELRGTAEYANLFNRLSLLGPTDASLEDLLKTMLPKDKKILKEAQANKK